MAEFLDCLQPDSKPVRATNFKPAKWSSGLKILWWNIAEAKVKRFKLKVPVSSRTQNRLELQTIRVKKEPEVLALKSRPYPKWTQCAVMNTKWALEGHQGDYRLMPEYTWEKSRFHLFLHKMWKLPFTKKIDQKLFIYVHCNALYIVHCTAAAGRKSLLLVSWENQILV